MSRSLKMLIAAGTVATLGIPALAVGASAPPDSAAPAGSAAPEPSWTNDELNTWALEYTGGTAGAAEGDPIKLGYVNQEALFPEATLGIKAAVAYVNAELGGAAGRPIELVECQVNTPEDGAACGAQMANDDSIVAVLTGAINVGNAELFNALNGNKPVLIGNGLTTDDFVTPAGVSYTAGATGVIAGLAKFVIEDFAPSSVAVVFVDNAGGQAAANALFKPAMDAAGITTSLVAVPETATSPDIAAAMQAAGADTADVFVSLLTLQGCIASYDSIQSLGIDPVLVTTGLCFGTPMTTHLEELGVEGDYPDGWYFGGYGYSYFLPDYESGMATYVAKVHEYGEPVGGASVIEYTGFGGPMFANLLTMTKFINELGADSLDFATVDATLRGFTGPMMIQAGPITCGLPPFVASCGHQMGIEQYIDGAWVPVHDALNGDPIDVTPAA
jgi:branched-chain amino acid transport system substrate-binding protein